MALQNAVTLTPVGSYRTSLDNEENAKRTVQRATLFSTVAVALLLLGAFPRPLIGLLALLPAFAGTMFAVFVYSLFNRSISLLAVGFGGAIVSFTVDYGIAYLLFLDRRHETKGFEASREVWSLGLIAMLTTAVSFAALSLSGFPALAEIGLFSALGVVFTYIFVHAIFPLVFARMPAAGREPFVPLQAFVNRIASSHTAGKPLQQSPSASSCFFLPGLIFILISLRSMQRPRRPWQLKSLCSRYGAMLPAACSSCLRLAPGMNLPGAATGYPACCRQR